MNPGDARQPWAPASEEALEQNARLIEEVRIARQASEITAQLVVEQVVLLEQMLRRLEENVAVEKELQAKLAVELSESEIRRRELNEARGAAEAANTAKSAFLAMMSHEIRTPMNAIIGMTTLLLDTRLNPEQREFVEVVRTSGESLLRIINDILDFSKIEAGKMELEAEPFDLRRSVESALDLVAPKASEKGLELGCLIEAHTPGWIIGDGPRLGQILINLLNNAVKFTEHGEVMASVFARALPAAEAPGEGVWHEFHFSVKDTGIGIPADRMDRLFKSFSQVDASTRRHYGGTGLGLAISRRLAELMCGSMWVESEAGKGSTFHFTIRARNAEGARPVYLVTEQPQMRDKRVLVVDDNETNRKIITLQLQSWGMRSVAIGSPVETLSLLRSGEVFDMALVDMNMPEMDGLAMAQQVRGFLDEKSLPMIMLTSLGDRPPGLEDYFEACMTKPVKASQLYNAILRVLAREKLVLEPSVEASEFDPNMGSEHPLRILVVEDNTMNQKLALIMLERLGYRADLAANGLEALNMLRRQPYDVALMDVQMPELDGLEATRRIRTEFPPEFVPRIVAMTANAMAEDREQCMAAGMHDYITKPILIKELVDALKRTESRTAARPAGEAAGPVAHANAPPLPGMPVAAVLDPAALDRLKALLGAQAETLLPGLLDGFAKDAPKLILQMHQALEQAKAPELRRAAHTLKSTAAQFGAKTLSGAAAELESLAKTGSFAGAGELIASLEAEYKLAQPALDNLRQPRALTALQGVPVPFQSDR